ncbi:hypothetical protein [Streptacidiphilus sp. EB103A]|uniref:hypothetical protein n=1 Tax=Streptacidiphilus sp. EB103A TaxID=3156275 RepID=UPI0035155D78
MSVVIGTASPGLTIPPALIERFGLFTIIVLGGTVLGVVDGSPTPRLAQRDRRR